jgi:epoxide hydrolase-like predicted phosphatase
MIKAIIFDYGGVFSIKSSLKDFGAEYAQKLGKDPEAFKKLMIDNWLKARVSDIDSAVFWEQLAAFLGVDKAVFRKDMIDYFGFRPEILDLARFLKTDYKLGLLSNHIEDWLEELIENHKLKDIFDVIVTSYGSRVAKPDISIFKEAVAKLGMQPEECVYIDDLEKNIPPAQEIGMSAILFKDVVQLRKELECLGIHMN